MIIKCLPTGDGKIKCPLFKTCLARLTDGTITGCGVPLAHFGLIRWQDVQVEHTIRKDVKDEQQTVS